MTEVMHGRVAEIMARSRARPANAGPATSLVTQDLTHAGTLDETAEVIDGGRRVVAATG